MTALTSACSETPLERLDAGPGRDRPIEAPDGGSADGGALHRPCIDVTPSQLNFSLTTILAPSRRTVLITNVCFGDLALTEIFIEPEDGPFSTSATPDILGPGQALPVELVFVSVDPQEGPWEAKLIVRSNDPDRTEVRVRLTASDNSERDCRLVASRPELDFGTVSAGDTDRQDLAFTVESTNHRCGVVAAALPGPDAGSPFVVTEPTRRFSGLSTGDTSTVTVEFTPPKPGAYRGELNLSASGWNSPITVELTGTGAP